MRRATNARRQRDREDAFVRLQDENATLRLELQLAKAALEGARAEIVRLTRLQQEPAA